MLRPPLTIIALNPADSDRRAHHIGGSIARQTRRRRWPAALRHVRAQPLGILLATPIHPRLERIACQWASQPVHQRPRPRVTQQSIRQKMQMFPALGLSIIAPTGGEPMHLGMVLTMAPMRGAHLTRATSEPLSPDCTLEVRHAVPPAAPQRAQQQRSVLGESGAAHGWDGQDEVPIAHPLVEHRAHLAAPVIHGDCGAPQAQRGLTAPRPPMGALSTLLATVCDVPHLCRIAPRQPLGHQASVGGGLIPRLGALKRVPVIGTALLEDTPGPRGWCHHRVVPSWGDERLTVKRLYHASSAASTPPRPVPGQSSLASCILESRGLPGPGK